MVDMKKGACVHPGCSARAKFAEAGSHKAEHCRQHARKGVDVFSKGCSHPGCTRIPSYGAVGTKIPLFCGPHATDGTVTVRGLRCSHPLCDE
ncbi:unnamed protein product [Ectocarpus sp. CCAP 1310/34]|nr:unnamed protein product [Ectocarpus sp. CCAP 1310/34]